MHVILHLWTIKCINLLTCGCFVLTKCIFCFCIHVLGIEAHPAMLLLTSFI